MELRLVQVSWVILCLSVFAGLACRGGGVVTDESRIKPVMRAMFRSTFPYRCYISAECKDERDCSWIEKELAKYGGNLEEYCELYKDRASIKQCRKTCKVCKLQSHNYHLENITFLDKYFNKAMKRWTIHWLGLILNVTFCSRSLSISEVPGMSSRSCKADSARVSLSGF